MEKSKTFCILPWIHAATYTDGSVLLCCVAKNSGSINLNHQNWQQAWNSDHFKQARLAMLEGRAFNACDHCYKEEAAGIRSHRQNENNLWYRELGSQYLDNLVQATHADGHVDNDLITIDLRLGNTCNLQCVMCRPVDSSKWVRDANILARELKTDAKYDWKYKLENFAIDNFDWYKDPEFWNSFFESAKDIRHIILAGGEPLYIKEHKEILTQLVNRGFSKNIELRYHTNGTIYNQSIVDLWQEFRRVEVMISMDGYGEVNSYIRYPADWHLLEKNLELYDCTPDVVDPKILCTVQALNIYWLPEFADWLISKNFKKISRKHHNGLFHPGILHWPQYLSPKVFPQSVKGEITQKLLSYCQQHKDNRQIQKFIGLVDFMNSEDHSMKFVEMIEYLEKLDELHGTNYKLIGDFFSGILEN